jgi:hypothetical protein
MELAASPALTIENHIFLIRGHKVLLDADLARLYEVETGRLNEAVRRNRDRFPEDFMFQLTPEETESLRSQFAFSNEKESRGGRRYFPYAFTEQGIAMLSSVLRSQRALHVNIAIMRTFVRMRHIASNEELAHRLNELERRELDQDLLLGEHGESIEKVFATLRRLLPPAPDPSQRRIGFPLSQNS